MIHCPSCGRYVGPHEACPYCGARPTGRLSIRALKVVAIVLAVVGLPVLWLAATRAEIPTVAIGRAGATMNLAYVRIEGRCSRSPSYDPQTEYLSFWAADDTGEIHILSYRTVTRALVREGNVPVLGDRISVSGTLRIRDDFRSLTIDAPDQLFVTRTSAVERAIGSIGPDDEYRRVRVRGQIRDVIQPYGGLTLVMLRDETGAIPIAVSEDLIALSGITPVVEIGQPVEVTATVSLYGTTPQLVPASTADIIPLDEGVSIAAQRFIVELGEGDVGRWVALRGMVAGVDPFSSGVKLALDDGSGLITVLLWQDVYDALRNGPEPAVGAEIKAQGELSQYKGELELIPELAQDVQVLAAATSTPDITAIGSVTAADVGRRVVLRGTLGSPQPFSVGIKYPLSDESGTIILLLWDEVYRNLSARDQLILGTVVEVTGEIDQYRGDLEIIPTADGVKVLE